MFKILLFGNKNDYIREYNLLMKIRYFEDKNQYIILGFLSNTCNDKIINFSDKSYNIYNIHQVDFSNIDYVVLVTHRNNYWLMYDNLLEIGLKNTKIIEGHIFEEKDFNLLTYKENNYLNINFYNNVIYDTSYINRDREYIGKNSKVILGKKKLYC